MISLNNKGQSLVLFVLIVPILFLILVLVFDVGNALIEKQELDNISYLTIEYGLEHMDEFSIETKMKNIVTKNNNKIENINIVINDDKIILTIKKNINGILVKNVNLVEIESKYIGYIKDGKKVIERV